MRNFQLSLENSYDEILRSFLLDRSETSLYQAQQFSRMLIEKQISPEELVSIHFQSLLNTFPDMPSSVRDSFDLLLEVMIAYGLAYQEHQSLKDRQKQLESEIDVAANMQQTLLPKDKPKVDSIDIGVISVPAKKMSGDYYHFIQDKDCFGIAIADIIGKGIPAALCMSMIKYAMDSLPEQRMEPGALLDSLNRVVEKNIDNSMFITMMYGFYDAASHLFYYSSAGHEPGFYYHADEHRLEELYAKGLALGIQRQTFYREYNKEVAPGDCIIFLSDGVTECRVGDVFIEREEIASIILKHIHLGAQEVVEQVYRDLLQKQGLEIPDDFTLMVIRRKV